MSECQMCGKREAMPESKFCIGCHEREGSRFRPLSDGRVKNTHTGECYEPFSRSQREIIKEMNGK